MITLTLLHPVQSTPVQSWSFEHDSVIRIGRAVDNHVVLYSAVVSRYHVEVRLTDNQWEVVNLGTNGTYLDGKRVHQAPLETGSILRLARSGPNIQVTTAPHVLGDSAHPEPAHGRSMNASAAQNRPNGLGATDAAVASPSPLEAASDLSVPFYVGSRYDLFSQPNAADLPPQPCNHEGASSTALICTDCGYPISPIQVVGPFQGLRRLSPSGNTLMAWRAGHTVVIKTLPSDYLRVAGAISQFEEHARQLCGFDHPSMPKMFEAFEAQGQPYIVSEMIYGPTLQDWVVEHGAVSQYQALQWVLELCRLLDYLHRQDPPYNHSAIAPANIIRPKIAYGSSQVVLVNFGEISLPVASSGTLPSSFEGGGAGKGAGSDPQAADLYALGTTLLYLLTGKKLEALSRAENQTIQTNDLPHCSPAVVDVAQRFVHPQPEQRFASAEAALNAIQLLL